MQEPATLTKRRISTFSLCLIFFSIFLIALWTFHSDDTNSFKAKTTNECIDEKACLKHVFLSEVIKNYDALSEIEKKNYKLERWNGAVYIGLFGGSKLVMDDVHSYGLNAVKTTKSLAPYFSQKLQMTDDRSKANVTIIYGDDIRHEMNNSFGIFSHFSSDFMKIIKEDDTKEYPKVMKFSKDSNNPFVINYGIILIQKKDGSDKVCYASLLSKLLGINEATSKNFGLIDYNDCDITNLHRLILTMLYERTMKPGANINEIESIVDDFYSKLSEEAESYKMKPSEMLARKTSDDI